MSQVPPYHIVIEPVQPPSPQDPGDPHFSAYSPDVPGLITVGETEEEARRKFLAAVERINQ